MMFRSTAVVLVQLLFQLVLTEALAGGTSNLNQSRIKPKVIPITVFSGFLGSGKTSLLQHLLQNNEGCRIAVIVNDVASMNIDAKLIAQQQGEGGGIVPAGIVQLQNGCACCSLSDELLSSVSELVTLNDLRSYENDNSCFDHIVIELSGLADPKSVRAKFQEAVLYDMPLMDRVRLDTMVSLVDCSVFLKQLYSAKMASPDEAPELFYRDGIKPEATERDTTDADEDDDLPPGLLEALMAGEDKYGSGDYASGTELNAAVVDLLVSQCEIADVVLLNKRDLATPEDMSRINTVVQALNPRATVLQSEYGRLPLSQILAVAQGRGVTQAGLVDDHKDFVQAATTGAEADVDPQAHTIISEHDSVSTDGTLETDVVEHDHLHAHSRTPCHDPDCTDTSHSHDHSHSLDHSCDDPECTDASHSHAHDRFAHGDMGTFVYRARRPFHPGRLVSFLQHLSVTRGLPDRTDSSTDARHQLQVPESGKSILKSILRSKGFLWCADSDEAAMFWSHAGISFELSCLGRWWATLDRAQWPAEAIPSILQDFDSAEHEESDSSFRTVGDRRQEIVFIGPHIRNTGNQKLVADVLDQCLLQDDEWASYCENRNDGQALRAAYLNPFQIKMLTY
jgi:G3E family GTPase